MYDGKMTLLGYRRGFVFPLVKCCWIEPTGQMLLCFLVRVRYGFAHTILPAVKQVVKC